MTQAGDRRTFEINPARILHGAEYSSLIVAVASALVILCIRIIFAALAPTTEDEAYYYIWSQHLAFGYYDHPPMVAWWVRAGTQLLGDRPLGVRLIPLVSSVATSVLIFDLGVRLGRSRACGAHAALWYNATVTVGLGAALAVPDVPASFFWALTLCCLTRTEADARWWAAAGLAAGLGVLSKYSALFLAPGALFWALSAPERRQMLGRPWPWIGAALAGLVALPNLLWNAQHHWLTFARQFGRIVPPGFAPIHLVQFVVLQSLLFGPVLIVYGWRAILDARIRTPKLRRNPEAWRLTESSSVDLILATSTPFLGYLVLHSLHSQIEEHWPVPLFAGGAVLASLGAQAWPGPLWLRRLPLIGIAVPPLVLAYVMAPNAAIRRDPALSLEDWPAFSQKIADLQIRQGAQWVGTVSYGTLAEFALAPIHPTPVIQLDERERYLGWPIAPAVNPAQPGLVVDLDRRMDATLMRLCFDQVQDLGLVGRGRPGASPATYRLFLVGAPRFDLIKVGCPSRKQH